MSHRFALLPLLAALLVLLGGATAGTAQAAPSMDVGIADDRLLFADDASAARTAAEWKASGVDAVRIIARWGAHAPAPEQRSAPAGFDAADPDDPRYDWRGLDRAVGAVRAQGMQVVLTVTGWGPVWGSQFPVKRNPRYKPDPAKFAAYATAVARRYGAQTDRYIVWNEPNIAQWLQPQSQCSSRGRCTPYAPHHYRRLARAAEPALRAADPGAQVMLGALAPRGTSGSSANGNLRPLSFLRAFGCVDRSYRKVRSGLCRGFRPATGDLFAYHPHGLKLAPSQPDRVADQAHLPDLGQVTSAVDRVQRAGGVRVRGASRFPFYLDEIAWQTAPPDRTLGVSAQQQSAYLQEAAYRAWAHPRVRGLTWYVWRDEPLGSGGTGWQSGMRSVDGRAKPALSAFPRPFWALRRARHSARLWGQVRTADGPVDVEIERRSGSAWRRVAAVRTDARGAFRRDVRITRATTFRFRWAGGTSDARTVRP